MKNSGNPVVLSTVDAARANLCRTRLRDRRMGRRGAEMPWGGVLLLSMVWWVGFGCAPNIDKLVHYHREGAFETAAKMVSGDPEMENALAFVIVENAAHRDPDALHMVDVLGRAGRPGRRYLGRLAAGEDVASRIARIALEDADEPDSAVMALCVDDAFGDVRYACVRRFHAGMDMGRLRRRILDVDPRVRLFAVKGLVRKGREHDVRALLSDALRRDPSSKVRAEAAEAGPLLGEDALLLLKTALRDPNQGVRLSAVRGIAALKSGNGNQVLEAVATEQMDEMALAAAAELARMGIPLGIERFEAALADERWTIRLAALLRLERADLPGRKERYAAFLEDDAPSVVIQTARLLRSEESTRAATLEALRKVWKKDISESAAARDAMATMGDEEAVQAVLRALDEGDEGDGVAMVAMLGRIEGAAAFRSRIVSLMGDARETVRERAAQSVIFYMSKN